MAGASRWLPAPLGVVSGPQDPAVGEVGRARQFGQDRGGVLVVGVVEYPGQERGPFPRQAPSSFGPQESSPLAPGQVAFQQGEDAPLLMVEMPTKDFAELNS